MMRSLKVKKEQEEDVTDPKTYPTGGSQNSQKVQYVTVNKKLNRMNIKLTVS